MDLQISGWGNSLGIRIPKAVAEQLGVKNGSKLKATVSDGKLIIKPKRKENAIGELAAGVDLEKLVNKITKKNRHGPEEFDDSPHGSEIW